ncbi:hypothetical protein METUNv1_01395 [Methyloversatilis universalis FAM5]|uniref:Uncharacterized protein n=1 Tax=Methyloversatilis universalis (strain ATCC BAA-1314 / DSM 25237 / JCM 13912 / CCUG 52030 / FAM5) TaxID=1000565 RepID=F5RB18_METUF|nr:hypothetical protein METUNv1_01395 [Methyloversatilis universalis FAM5]
MATTEHTSANHRPKDDDITPPLVLTACNERTALSRRPRKQRATLWAAGQPPLRRLTWYVIRTPGSVRLQAVRLRPGQPANGGSVRGTLSFFRLT